ncbi:unnamed protein product [Trichogramma brassicae]|uniref:Uncharacterized protein n=1 Tax=Trichogramma brassicae TaxID=86971 RepID=A0A6H5IMC0_9HYME|nr:unnamed protein product [Trichogramma brassicae]
MSTTKSTTIRMMPGGASFCRQKLADERRESEDWLNPRVITYKHFIDSVEKSTKELTIGERTRLSDNNNDRKQLNYWTFKRNFVARSSLSRAKTKKTMNKSDATSLLLNEDDDVGDNIFQDVSGDAKLRFDNDDDRVKFLRFKAVWRLVKSVTVASVVVILQLYQNWVGSNNKQQRAQQDLQ